MPYTGGKLKSNWLILNAYELCFADEMVVSAKVALFSDRTMERAIIYSTPQSSAEDIGCITMSYMGESVHLQVFITQGTIYTNDKVVFKQQDIDSSTFASASFQTPANIPYMVKILFLIYKNLYSRHVFEYQLCNYMF